MSIRSTLLAAALGLVLMPAAARADADADSLDTLRDA